MNDNILVQIIDILKKESTIDISKDVDEIEMLIKKEKYRMAYSKMYELKNSNLWTPSTQYLHLMELFWWNYAN